MISTTVSDIGLVRKDNQDSTFSGVRLVAVCDGMGGHAGGDTASTIAIRSLAHIETIPLTAKRSKAVEDVSTMLSTSVIAAHDAIVGRAHREKQLAGMGTTVTAVALVAGYWVIAHIGDSRAYLLREGEITQITKDHSYVQHLIDTGRITEEEAKSHPQRNVVMRVLGDFDIDPRPDISVRKAQAGDRWLLCSDGLSGSVSDSSIRDTLMTHPHLQECAQTLVSMAEKGGSTDNVSAVIADAYDVQDTDSPISMANASTKMCLVGGAASKEPQPIADTLNMLVAVAPRFVADDILNSPALKAAQLTNSTNEQTQQTLPETSSDANTHSTNDEDSDRDSLSIASHDFTSDTSDDDFDSLYEVQRIVPPSYAGHDGDEALEIAATGEIPIVRKNDGSLADDPHDPDVAEALRMKRREEAEINRKRKVRLRIIRIVASLVVLLTIITGGIVSYNWSQSQYFVKDNNGVVAIYQGVDTNIFGYSLNHVLEDSDVSLRSLPQGWRERVRRGINVNGYRDARNIIQSLERQIESSQTDSTDSATTNNTSSSNSQAGSSSEN
ncbi:Stp1/IreP family PP2C-type Ser/Thr phosphatase [Alloscardovia theropitheci]|uniref:Stp1/IreP family PP2C-type Ser/Thr phosphatase n=2 Tax=Alloscardovia theropitheci TaxID=2496842 RepID=A0A4R0QY00_9BIFI|nr:Stp1/IreP family PP2C-type Ser/Thr phosphatase [Alloscardovia theropitheci]